MVLGCVGWFEQLQQISMGLTADFMVQMQASLDESMLAPSCATTCIQTTTLRVLLMPSALNHVLAVSINWGGLFCGGP